MHLGATVQHRLLIVQILLKPENSRKTKTAAKPFTQAAELFFVPSKASPERYIQGSCSDEIKVLHRKSVRDARPVLLLIHGLSTWLQKALTVLACSTQRDCLMGVSVSFLSIEILKDQGLH